MQVVVVDDEPRLLELIVKYLSEAGFTATGHSDGLAGFDAAQRPGVDALVLDLMLPGLNGLEVCRALRRDGHHELYILMLTARGAVKERVAGLDAGADDYLVKPFALQELAARLRAVRRRHENADAMLSVGDLTIDPSAHRAWRGEVEVELSQREFAVLHALMDNAGRVVSRAYILREVWGSESDLASNAIDVHVSKLRARIDKPFGTTTIRTLRGVGYRLETRT